MNHDEIVDMVMYLHASGVRVASAWINGEPHCEVEGCDGAPRVALEWAEARGVARSRLKAYLDECGTPCDCAILMDLELAKPPRLN